MYMFIACIVHVFYTCKGATYI